MHGVYRRVPRQMHAASPPLTKESADCGGRPAWTALYLRRPGDDSGPGGSRGADGQRQHPNTQEHERKGREPQQAGAEAVRRTRASCGGRAVGVRPTHVREATNTTYPDLLIEPREEQGAEPAERLVQSCGGDHGRKRAAHRRRQHTHDCTHDCTHC